MFQIIGVGCESEIASEQGLCLVVCLRLKRVFVQCFVMMAMMMLAGWLAGMCVVWCRGGRTDEVGKYCEAGGDLAVVADLYCGSSTFKTIHVCIAALFSELP